VIGAAGVGDPTYSGGIVSQQIKSTSPIERRLGSTFLNVTFDGLRFGACGNGGGGRSRSLTLGTGGEGGGETLREGNRAPTAPLTQCTYPRLLPGNFGGCAEEIISIPIISSQSSCFLTVFRTFPTVTSRDPSSRGIWR